jgi:hypothetical protein
VGGPLATVVLLLYYRDADAVGCIALPALENFSVPCDNVASSSKGGTRVSYCIRALSDRLTAPPIDASLLCLLSLAWFQN